MRLEENTLKEEIVYSGEFINISKLQVKLPDGNKANREVIRHPGGVAVLAFYDSETLIMVEQYRKAIDRVTLELPAGKIENKEEIIETAKRELEEETGYLSDKFEYLGKIVTAPGFCDEYIHYFKCEDLRSGFKGGDDDEFINVKKIKIDDIKKMIKNGDIIDGKTIAALMFL